MALRNVVKLGDPVLTKKCRKVEVFDSKLSDLIDDIFGLSLQISTAQTFLQLHKKEAATKKKLYDTLKTLEDKNKVLSFISANDQLTGLYNRRGFMEHVIDETRENEGSTAILFFSDLDHLKEINDVFGHSEGDYALLHAAEILQNTFRSIGFAGRLGGDEFVSMVVSNDQEITEKILKKLKQATAELNGISGKPYYIEFSTGYVRFTCSPETSISDMINAADEALYEAKQSRRKSIRRDQ